MFTEAKQLLDKQAPGWAWRIHLGRLKLQSCRRCVLGQLFGTYVEGLMALGLDDDRAKDLGFERSDYWTYPRLNYRWNQFIKSVRRGGIDG